MLPDNAHEENVVSVLDRNTTAWVGGIALPIAMVVLDPTVFRSTVFGTGTAILGAYKPFGYTAIGCGIAAVTCLLLFKRPSALLAGILTAASLFALALGVELLPFSFLGTFVFGIGLLGLSPFVSSVVIGWRARKTYREAPASSRLFGALLGFGLFWAVCGVVQWQASSALANGVNEICSGPERVSASGAARLARWQFLLDLDQLVPIWVLEQDGDRKERLAIAYRQLTGGNIADRAAALMD